MSMNGLFSQVVTLVREFPGLLAEPAGQVLRLCRRARRRGGRRLLRRVGGAV
jgi:hypothetical protein